MDIPIIQPVPKFACSACGTCCSHLRGFVSEEDRTFVREHGFGQLPLVQLLEPEQMTFPLWGFEKVRFEAYAEELGIDPRIEPSRAVLDLDSESAIILTYQMSAKSCPFLSAEGKCTVYAKERAYVCNLFPLNRTPFTGAMAKKELFGECGAIKDILPRLDFTDEKRLLRQLHDAFGDILLAAIQHEQVTQWSNKVVLNAMKDRRIRPAVGMPYRFLKKRIENARKVDVFDFIVEKGVMSAKERDAMLGRFSRCDDAREWLKTAIDL